MSSPARLSKVARRAAIIVAVRPLFAERGGKGVTTRELADAAGISEALLFRHFPSKEALYAEAQVSAMGEDAEQTARIEALPVCTETLVAMLGEILSRITSGSLSPRGEGSHFKRLILTSLMEGGEFARHALQGMPSRMNRKLAACLEAAVLAGDARPGPPSPWVAAWFANHVGVMLMLHLSPGIPIIDYGVTQEDLARQALWFCLRGMGVKDEAIERCLGVSPAPSPIPLP
jgi:AcrR family transcriptional regulator